MKPSTTLNSKIPLKAGVIFIWLAIWEILSRIVDNKILFVGPYKVLACLFNKAGETEFWTSIGGSLLNIAGGFFMGLTVGVLLAVLSYRLKFCRELFKPVMAFLKAAPVASFIVLFLIWWKSSVLSIAVSMCIVLPQIYIGMLQGLDNIDRDMLKMADIYKFSTADRLHYIYRPGIAGYMEGAIKVSAGMAWKSGIAAEVIGTPDMSIGEKLYMSKIYLDTEGVLAWTLAIILLSVLCEWFLLKMYDLYNKIDFKCRGAKVKTFGISKLSVRNVVKKYGERKVLDNYSAEFANNDKTVLEWESGAGKTTLFKIISREEKADLGSVEPLQYEVSVLFQEDRLCEQVSAVKNVELVTGDRKAAKEELLKILDAGEINRPVTELSGGQKRRVAIARCLSKDADVYLLDEPFNGLDEDNRRKVNDYINETLKDKIVIMASHVDAGEEVN